MDMENLLARINQLEATMVSYGHTVIVALVIVIAGLILIKWVNRGFKNAFNKMDIAPNKGSMVRNILCVLMFAAMIIFVAIVIGLEALPVIRFLSILAFIAIGMIIAFRPLFPSLPFKVGNTIKAGDLVGKVETTTALNTRLRTFDGATIYVPNRKILGDTVINYQVTPSRRLDLKVNIHFDQDLMKSKEIIEDIMTADRRVHTTPRPIVHVMSLDKGCVELQGRCWTDNLKRFVLNCELLEKTKLRFDQEGIKMAVPQMRVHHSGAYIPRAYSVE
jgi:small conductance mechanosensitive channel